MDPRHPDQPDAQAIIETREAAHGDYRIQAQTAQTIKDALRAGSNWHRLSSAQRETVDMIAVKLSRIVNGNPNEPDHYLDIAGYATLVHNILTKGSHL